ncbi:Serine/threonine-protein phosphatase 6 regulatory ankyrin repeat subunit C [Madurella fahalii]|uniref:Serine/threonine-protein phosphatase 6 regulatory ankyrin repeat subunit C n=1 Tax=Madurella fahalii TaxID=1157608 RepID=A0ABQ0GSZ3_9PEZI
MGRFKSEHRRALRLSDLHIAVLGGETRNVREILRSDDGKKTINSRDAYGSTPLMIAVLTGRLTIARLLLRNGASTALKDYRGHTALKYGRASFFTRKLDAYRRLGLRAVSKTQEKRRARIATILRHPAACASSRLEGEHEFSSSFLYKADDRLVLLKPEDVFRLDKQQLESATTGVIASLVDPMVKMAAVSGWTSNTERGNKTVLDNSKYTRLVRDVSEFLGFNLSRSFRDKNGKPLPEHAGRFNACHVEKKLAMYWVIATLNAVLGTTDFRQMPKLQGAVVPDILKQALIILDHWPCGNCWKFLDLIKRVTGIDIFVEPRPFLVRGIRQSVAGCRACKCERCVRTFKAAEDNNTRDQNDKNREGGDLEEEEVLNGEDVLNGEEVLYGEDIGDDTNVGTGNGDVEAQPRAPIKQATQARVPPTSSPEDWKVWVSAPDQAPVAKPRCQPVDPISFKLMPACSQAQGTLQTATTATPAPRSQASPPRARTSTRSSSRERPDPVSTVAGRSGFFASPAPNLQPNAADDIQRFAYRGGAIALASSATPSTPSSPARRSSSVSWMVRKRAKWEEQNRTNNRSRARESARDAKFRTRSIFARVARRSQKQGAGLGVEIP